MMDVTRKPLVTASIHSYVRRSIEPTARTRMKVSGYGQWKRNGCLSRSVLLLAGLEFVLDAGVAARFVDPDYRRRMTVENMVAALRSAR